MSRLVPKIVPGDWNAVAYAIAKLDSKLNTGAAPTFADLTLSSPSNIYSLSHDSFADFIASEHLDHALTKDAALVNWWRMDDISGSTVTDLGSGGDDGTLVNGIQVDGIIGKAVSFDGTGNSITLANYSQIDGATAFSVCARFKVDELPSSLIRGLLSSGDASNRIPWIFFPNGTNTLRVQVYDGSALTVTDYTLTTTDWYSLVYTFNYPGDGIMYIDGVEVARDTAINPAGITSAVTGYLGFLLGLNSMKGDIDDVRVYSRILTPAEALEYHQLGTLDAMTTFAVAYFTKYIASRSGHFDHLHATDAIINTGEIAALTATTINATTITASGTIQGEHITSTDDISMQGRTLSLGSAAEIDVTISFEDDDGTGTITYEEGEFEFNANLVDFLGSIRVSGGINSSGNTNLGNDSGDAHNIHGVTKIGDGGVTNYIEFSATSDVIFKGSSGLAYGSMYSNTDIDVTLTTQGQWYEIDSAQAWVSGKVHNCTFADPKITVTNAGTYWIVYTVSSHINANGQRIEYGIMIDSTNTDGPAHGAAGVQLEGRDARIPATLNDVGHQSGTAIIQLAAGKTISLAARNTTSANDTLSAEHPNLVVTQIAGGSA